MAANITVDQLIADLCVARGSNPEVGTWFLSRSKIENNSFYLEITNGQTVRTFAIEMPINTQPIGRPQ